MPRDGSGNYTLPAGNPVVTNTLIESAWANPTMSDIAVQLNNVLTRDGLLGPINPFKLVDGAVATPGLSFNSEPGLGFYRRGTSQLSVAATNATVFDLDANGVLLTIASLYPRTAGVGDASKLVLSNKPFATANSSNLSVTVDDTKILVASAVTGSGTKLPLVFDAFASGLLGKNKLINPGFTINNYSGVTGAYAAGAFFMDRWKAGAAGCNVTISTVGLQTTITINTGSIIQIVEDRNIEGGVYCCSWTGTATGKFAGGALAVSPIVSAALPAGVQVPMEFGPGTITNVKLELGATPTTFQPRLVGEEVVLCARYCPVYVSNAATEPIGMGQCTGASSAFIFFRFNVEPRVPPVGVVAAGVYYLTTATGTATPTLSSFGFSTASRQGALCSMGIGSAVLVAGNATLLSLSSASGSIRFTGCEL